MLTQNLKDVKYVLFDFDDTLCIHSNHQAWTNNKEHKFDVCILQGGDPYAKSAPNYHMAEFIRHLKEADIKMGLISHISSVPQAIIKERWVEENYNIKLDNFCVGSREHKVEMLKHIADGLHIRHSQILIIDDAYMTLAEADSEGFQTATPMEIVNLIYQYKGHYDNLIDHIIKEDVCYD